LDNQSVVRLLIQNGANINAKPPKHATPNSSTDKGITPLHNVAIPYQAQAASVLLEHGTRANQQTNTTLHSLISLCHTEVFKYHDL